MTPVAESRERDDEVEDTIIGSGTPELSPPDVTGSDPTDIAEAQTIIASKADPRHSERTFTAVEVPDPEQPRALYAIRVGMHSLIPLEVPAYIGRRPSAPRISGLRAPRLVMVPSPSHEVSSTHVEILQEADTVVVTDLGSTNGTTVTMAGFAPRTLRQGESLVVGVGTLVDIGDGIQIVIVTLPDNAVMEGTQ